MCVSETHDSHARTIKLGPFHVQVASFFWAGFHYTPRCHTGERVPLIEKPFVQEDEEPYREGHARVFRLWPSNWALILGWWGDSVVDEQAGERRALSEVLAQGTHQVAQNKSVTSLIGPTTVEELTDRVADLITVDDDDDFDEDVTVTDLRPSGALPQ